MKVGFTGTQAGMTDAQRDQVSLWFQSLGVTEFHHGDCVGADAQAHELALAYVPSDQDSYVWVTIHPPINPSKRAFCSLVVGSVFAPQEYLARNHDIVDRTEILIATPKGPEEMRSGTWATIRYARKCRKPVYLVMPDGSVP